MRIFVDADAFPNVIKDILIKASLRLNVRLVFVANKPLRLDKHAHISVMLVPDGPDVADDRIAELVRQGDLVITADIPLAEPTLTASRHAGGRPNSAAAGSDSGAGSGFASRLSRSAYGGRRPGFGIRAGGRWPRKRRSDHAEPLQPRRCLCPVRGSRGTGNSLLRNGRLAGLCPQQLVPAAWRSDSTAVSAWIEREPT